MSESSHSVPGVRAALLGFITGLGLCLFGFTIGGAVMLGDGVVGQWKLLLALSLVGGVVFAIGRGLSGGVEGSLLGAFAGMFLGAAASSFLPEWSIEYPSEPTADKRVPFSAKGPTLGGESYDLADYRGKVVLVDFWATWCRPCVASIPGLKATYNKFHPLGFEMVGISLDSSKAKLEEFVKEQKLPWPQVFFPDQEKEGYMNPIAKEYDIQGIPATFLIDREGRIAASGLHGKALREAVAKELNLVEVTQYVGMLAGALLCGFLGALLQRFVMAPASP